MIHWQHLTFAFLVGGAVLGAAQDLPVRPPLITPAAERSIERGLAYLVNTQGRDGLWRSSGGLGSYPCTMTSLAGLALLAAGNTPHQGPYAVNVRRAVDAVMNCAGPTGLIARIEEEQRPMYSHGFGMLFLAQVYGTEFDPVRQEALRRILEKAVTLTGASQSKEGGWLYAPDDNGDEGSVTVTQIQGLRAARNAGIKVPKEIIDRAIAYIVKSANEDGGIRYSLDQKQGKSRPPITAAAVATLYNAGQYENPVALRALDYIKKTYKPGDKYILEQGHEYYSILYLSQAMYLSSEDNWVKYFPTVRDKLIKRQAPEGSWMGDGVGETYGTAIALLSLQLPYGYLPILQR